MQTLPPLLFFLLSGWKTWMSSLRRAITTSKTAGRRPDNASGQYLAGLGLDLIGPETPQPQRLCHGTTNTSRAGPGRVARGAHA
ncbi:uncharacterized protein B0I36DRAFT_314605 [Microdochium trichocladiopsis]|uniref:Uncharacterized protein n=1 Tax=Microdochium trichocladiopsis TaxID=1682393 RepID=A0A9P8YEC7_9PEZI|nr:uncharacterized protein B0I36DRAFT_314605 [Microdochium trichocladiopsis]KAH7037684.1 hypothetical protein B0I36DRAFT_314605 [Microdochium trichocladiopsis]